LGGEILKEINIDDYIPQEIEDKCKELGKSIKNKNNKSEVFSVLERISNLIEPYFLEYHKDKLKEEFEHFAEVDSRTFKEGD
jgi:uncharacterized secreted protein with C-terminal beta-propeller domain